MGFLKKLVDEVKYGPGGPSDESTPDDPHAAPPEEAIQAKLRNFGVATIYLTTDGRIVYRPRVGKDQSGPVAGAVATVETSGNVVARDTWTRNSMSGGMFGDKMVDKREAYLTISGKGLAVASKLNPEATVLAREFAAAVNAASRAAEAQPAAVPATSPTSVLVDLAKLHQAGVLTDEEFAAKKAEILGRI